MSLGRSLRAQLKKAGQEFLVERLSDLEPARREALLAQIQSLDLDLIAALRNGKGVARPAPAAVEPLPYVAAEERGPGTEAAARGRSELARGRVAFALLAGGQASRLRWDGPKGTYPIGPATERSLFQILVEHVRRAKRDHGLLPHLAVTTSATTDAAIRSFFERHDCFGFDRDRLRFARQASLPALDDDGRLLLSTPDRIFSSPDGHGGAVRALETAGILEAWEQAGVTTVCTFQVDNPLLRVVDADFLGRLHLSGAPIATKIVLKTQPEEKVGVVARAGGRPAIVEYSEITPEQARSRDPDGALTFRLGSIAVHAFRLDFLRAELAKDMPLHVARKEIPSVAEDGTRARRPGRKFERFLFDLFPAADSITVVEAVREREYAPLKNAEGRDSPVTVRSALDGEYRRWYRDAGVAPPEGILELSPLDALGPEDL